nr:GHKL domain-containing protein [uncultured Niameybacter sp.]
MIYTFFEILFCLCDIWFLHVFCGCFLEKRYEKIRGKEVLFILLSGVFSHISTSGIFYSTVSTGLTVLLMIGYCVYMYKGKILIRIVMGTSFNVLLGTITTIILNSMAFGLHVPIEELVAFNTVKRIVIVLCVKLILLIILLIIKRFSIPVGCHMPKVYPYMMSGLSFISFLSIQILFKMSITSPDRETFGFLIILVCIFLLFNLIIYILCYYLITIMDKQNIAEIVASEQKNLQKHLEEMELPFNEIRKIKHDLLNHYSVIEYLVKADEKERCLAYMKKLLGTVQAIATYYKTGNPIADAIVNQKIYWSKQYGIAYDLKIDVPEKMVLSSEDFATILFNLFDNAIEATKEVEEERRKIKVMIYTYQNKLLISFSNPVISNPIMENGELRRRKKENSEEHGHGMKNIEYAAKKYNGYIQYTCKNQTFNIEVLVDFE